MSHVSSTESDDSVWMRKVSQKVVRFDEDGHQYQAQDVMAERANRYLSLDMIMCCTFVLCSSSRSHISCGQRSKLRNKQVLEIASCLYK